MTPKVRKIDQWLTDVPLEEMQRVVDALYRIHRLLSLMTDLDLLLERIIEESKQVASAEAGSLLLYDGKTEELYFFIALGESGDQQALKQDLRLKLGQGIAGASARQRESILVPDVSKDPRFFAHADALSKFETKSLLAVPLVDRDSLVGVLEVMNKTGGGSFTELDRRTMEIFSSLAASVIANARLIEENVRAERLAGIGEAVAGLSHYVKNIIGGLSGSVEIIDLGLDKDDTAILKKGWKVLKRSVDRIAGVVEDMLAYSKPRRPVCEPCDLSELLQESVDGFKGSLLRRTVALNLDTAGLTGPVSCDSRGIHRCVLNLLSNALDAVPADGGLIRVRAWSTGSDTAEIEISDNGPGVAPESASRIFEPFFSTKGGKGTGLGLAVTRKIVDEHGGTIVVSPGPQGGAAFRITLPAGHRAD